MFFLFVSSFCFLSFSSFPFPPFSSFFPFLLFFFIVPSLSLPFLLREQRFF